MSILHSNSSTQLILNRSRSVIVDATWHRRLTDCSQGRSVFWLWAWPVSVRAPEAEAETQTQAEARGGRPGARGRGQVHRLWFYWSAAGHGRRDAARQQVPARMNNIACSCCLRQNDNSDITRVEPVYEYLASRPAPPQRQPAHRVSRSQVQTSSHSQSQNRRPGNE